MAVRTSSHKFELLLMMLLQEDKLVASFDAMSLFRPPIVRSASVVLDRALFSKTIPIAAARIANPKNISRFRTALDKSGQILRLERLANIQPDPDQTFAQKGGKCVLLVPQVKPEGIFWSNKYLRWTVDSFQIQKHGVQLCRKL